METQSNETMKIRTKMKQKQSIPANSDEKAVNFLQLSNEEKIRILLEDELRTEVEKPKATKNYYFLNRSFMH